MTSSRDLRTTISYFSRSEKFLQEKPYTTSFPVDGIEGAQVDNHEWEQQDVLMHDLRGVAFIPRMDVQGFTYAIEPTKLKYDDFSSKTLVETSYYAEISAFFKKQFPQYKTVAILGHEIRRRDPRFPAAKGQPVAYAQPFAYAHVDWTLESAVQKLRLALPPDRSELLARPFDVLNVWRLLKGPNDDWPLAFCDHATVNQEEDIILHDIVYEDAVGEDSYLKANRDHVWYYLSKQTTDEIYIWRNTNGPKPDKPCAYHCAFSNPDAVADTTLRESIEVRLVAFL